MKKAFYTWLYILISLSGFGQLTNDWINYDHRYFKINVFEDGVYRIDYSTLAPVLQAAGISGTAFRLQDIQIFGRGEELYIHVEGSGPASDPITSLDYIELYAKKNTGWLDTAFYANSAWHANPNVSLFTDTATYYLSWDTTTTNRRLEQLTNINFSGKTSEDYFMFESRKDYFTVSLNGQYFNSSGFSIYEPEYTVGKGWSGPVFTSTYTISVPTTNVYTSGPSATASTVVIGGNLNAHVVAVGVAQTASSISFSGIKVNKLSYSPNAADLGSSNTNFTFSPQPSSNDRNSVAFISIEYPHTLNLGSTSTIGLGVPDATTGDTAYLNFTSFNDQGQTSWIYDLTNNRRIVVVDNGSTHEVLIPNSGGVKKCFLFSEGEITTVSSLSSVGLAGDGKFTDYASLPNDSAYLIVYNRKLRDDGSGNDFVAQYIGYRSTHPNGGKHDVIAADIDELYDQFAYGIRKSPMAIRGFAEYTLSWPTKPQNLLLLGKGVSYNASRSTSLYYNTVLVPTYG